MRDALDGITGTIAIHICFGYAAIIQARPQDYSFLPELAGSPLQQVSIETAQSNLDARIGKAPGKTIILGTLDLSDMTVERLKLLPPVSAARCHMCRRSNCGRARLRVQYLPRDIAYQKICAIFEGAGIVRREFTAS